MKTWIGLPFLAIFIAIGTGTIFAEREDRISFFLDLAVAADETVTGDVVCVFCSAEIAGTVAGDAVSVMGNLVITGKVEGDAVAAGGYVDVGPESVVKGDLVAVGGSVYGARVVQGDRFIEEVWYFHIPGQRHLLYPGAAILLTLCGAFGGFAAIVLGRRRVSGIRSSIRHSSFLGWLVGFVLATVLITALIYIPDSSDFWEMLTLLNTLTQFGLFLVGLGFVSLWLGTVLRTDLPVAGLGLMGGLMAGVGLVIPLAGFVVWMLCYIAGVGIVGCWGVSKTFRRMPTVEKDAG